jgi:subtilisin family serine protease
MTERGAKRRTTTKRLFSFCLLAALAGASPSWAAPFTPPIWRETARLADGREVPGKLVGWNRDQNQNFVDDLIDERIKAGVSTHDLIVDFNRCVTCCNENATGEEEIVQILRKVGTLDYLGKYVTFAVVLGVSAADVEMLANREEVAMIEVLDPDSASLDVSVAAIRVRSSGTFTPFTVEDASPGINGGGGNIAVIDSGVDDFGGPGVTHAMFPAGTFVAGGNCLTNPCTFGDPDDDNGHGSHVAGIALGRSVNCGVGVTCRGVAPGAGLVDIKVLNNLGSSVGSSVLRGVELAINWRAVWNLRVLNLSIQNCHNSNGVNAAAQLLNTAVSLGLVVVVAAGNTNACNPPLANNANFINDWSSASLAITVAAVDDRNTVPLGDDGIPGFSLTGPRLSDNDGDPRDEQKPEISAPGTAIRSAQLNTANGFIAFNGTSMAAPHVAGAAALLLQASPGMNPGSVKEVLIATAVQSTKPGPHPGWHPFWGFGFLNVHAALSRTLVTDVGRPTNPPYAPCNSDWCSPHISTASAPRINQANSITAQVRNHGGVAANNVRVCFGVYVFSNNSNRFHEISCRQVNIPATTTQNVTIPWTPSAALIPPGFPIGQALHTCIKVSIDYPFDTVTTNNTMQRNTSVATASIARVPFRLENNTTEPVDITLKITNDNPKWAVRVFERGVLLQKPAFHLEPTDCPHDLIIELEPAPDAPVGDQAQVVVQAVTAEGEDFGGIVVNGIHVDHTVPGTLQGHVTDPQGTGLPGVVIALQDVNGNRATAVTDATGFYRAVLLEGQYFVTFDLAGCGTQVRLVTIDPGQSTALDVLLPCGTVDNAAAAPKSVPRTAQARPASR